MPSDTEKQPQPNDQCIFLRYYKIKYRRFLPSKLEANAEPPFLDEDRGDGGGLATPATDAYIEMNPELVPVGLIQIRVIV